jgi:hypothetical protein
MPDLQDMPSPFEHSDEEEDWRSRSATRKDETVAGYYRETFEKLPQGLADNEYLHTQPIAGVNYRFLDLLRSLRHRAKSALHWMIPVDAKRFVYGRTSPKKCDKCKGKPTKENHIKLLHAAALICQKCLNWNRLAPCRCHD